MKHTIGQSALPTAALGGNTLCQLIQNGLLGAG
jgi:hypothetical protein